MQPRPRRSTLGDTLSVVCDPLAAEGSLPPTAASEIVKAARASLREPTRPITPDTSRHLLKSAGNYSNRPQTSGSQPSSQEFLSAATNKLHGWGVRISQAAPWSIGSTANKADIWVAGENAATSDCSNSLSVATSAISSSRLGAQRRTTLSAPSQQQPQASLPAVGRVVSSNTRLRASSAGIGSRLSELASLSTLRPPTAPKAVACALQAATPSDATVAHDAENSSKMANEHTKSIRTTRLLKELPDTVPTQRSSATAGEDAGADTSSCLQQRPSSSDKGASAGSRSSISSDLLSSRSSLVQPEQELLCEGCDNSISFDDSATDAAESSVHQTSQTAEWQWQVLQVLQRLQGQSLSPADATALLHACSALQSLLDTAADWGHLQQWLSAPMPQSTPTATARPQVSAGVPALTTTANNANDTIGRCSKAAGCLQEQLLQSLIPMVDSPMPDVLVKVGAMLLRIVPVSSPVLLPAVKMLYSLSKDSGNDSRFRHHGVLRPLLHMTSTLSLTIKQQVNEQQLQQQDVAQQQQQQQASTLLVYCSGSLKNISANLTNQKSLGRLNAVSAMAQVLAEQIEIAQACQALLAATPQQQQQQQRRQRLPQHEASAQVCIQVTAVLRNLAVVPENAIYFTEQQGLALQALLNLIQPFDQDPEVALNISRCLSKLSLQASCRECLLTIGTQQQLERPASSRTSSRGSSRSAVAAKVSSRCSSSGGNGPVERCSSNSSIQRGHVNDEKPTSTALVVQPSAIAILVRLLLQLQVARPQQWPTAVRVAFVLGNLTTYHPESRSAVAAVPGVLDSLPDLLLGLVHYGTMQQQQQSAAEELIVKLLRVLANIAIDSTVGATLAAKQATADALVQLLTCFQYEQSEELIMNAAAAVTNLSFYDTPSNKLLQMDADVLLLPLLPLLTSGNEEATIEAARAVGNLSRASPAARAALLLSEQQGQQEQPAAGAAQHAAQVPCQQGSVCQKQQQLGAATPQRVATGPFVLRSLVLLLDHSSWEVVYSVAGALVNLTASAEAGAALSSAHLATAVKGALQRVRESMNMQEQQLDNQQDACAAAAELLLQCVANMASASAAAVSEAILGASPHCAEPSCSSQDLAGFSRVIRGLAAEGVEGDQGGGRLPPWLVGLVVDVQERLFTLWGV